MATTVACAFAMTQLTLILLGAPALAEEAHPAVLLGGFVIEWHGPPPPYAPNGTPIAQDLTLWRLPTEAGGRMEGVVVQHAATLQGTDLKTYRLQQILIERMAAFAPSAGAPETPDRLTFSIVGPGRTPFTVAFLMAGALPPPEERRMEIANVSARGTTVAMGYAPDYQALVVYCPPPQCRASLREHIREAVLEEQRRVRRVQDMQGEAALALVENRTDLPLVLPEAPAQGYLKNLTGLRTLLGERDYVQQDRAATFRPLALMPAVVQDAFLDHVTANDEHLDHEAEPTRLLLELTEVQVVRAADAGIREETARRTAKEIDQAKMAILGGVGVGVAQVVISVIAWYSPRKPREKQPGGTSAAGGVHAATAVPIHAGGVRDPVTAEDAGLVASAEGGARQN